MVLLAVIVIALGLPSADAYAQTRLPHPVTDAVADAKLLPAGCKPEALYIDADVPKTGDGSIKAPFATVREALAHAEKVQACAIFARVAPGDYAEGPLTVSLPTILVGRLGVNIQGSFEVVSPTLVLSTITVIGDPQSLQPSVLGKGVAHLGLRRVRFVAPCGHAIRLDGPGAMRAVGVYISRVCTLPDDPASGSAIHLTGGVDAELQYVTLVANVRGLYASGAGTESTQTLSALQTRPSIQRASRTSQKPAPVALSGSSTCRQSRSILAPN
jgi:hypothetical protein